MRMTLYYLAHSVKNQIRKLLRTWVAVFLLVCFLFGALVGIGVGVIGSLLEEKYAGEDTEVQDPVTEELPDGEAEPAPLDPATRNGIFELVAGGIALLMLSLAVLGADKGGSSIFLPADVNLLFPAPLKPQTVLLFRLVMQTGGVLLATAYLLFQIPSMVLSAGLGGLVVFALLAAWLLLLVFTRLVSILLYTVTTTHITWKRHLRTGLLAVLAVIGLSYYLYAQKTPAGYGTDALAFFNAPITRYIPLWGWLKAMVLFALQGNVALTLASLAALVALGVVLVAVIWRLKADFYEDAMARSEETAAAQEQMQTGGKSLKQRKKDRSDRLRRDGFSKGAGASVYFHKTLYNRFRFAYGRVFTKTSLTYLALAGGAALLMRFVLHSSFFPLIPMLLSGVVFFRSLGNPIATDVEKESFALVPDSAHKKVFFSFAGGVVNSTLDLLPGYLLSSLLLWPNPGEALLWLVLILCMGAYSDAAGMFIDLSLSTGLSQTLRSLVQILFVYFGLLPAIAMIAVGYLLGAPLLFVGLAILLHLAITALSLVISPLFIERGRK